MSHLHELDDKSARPFVAEEKRECKRSEILLPGKLTVDSVSLVASIRNLSSGGALLVVETTRDTVLHAGQDFTFHFRLSEDFHHSIKGQIVRLFELDETQTGIAARF